MTRVALIVGGSIGREIVPPVLEILEAAGGDLEWERVEVPPATDADPEPLLRDAMEAVRRCRVGLKTRLIGPSPAGSGRVGPGVASSTPETLREAGNEYAEAPGPRNPNVLLRHRLGLFAGVRPIRPLPGISTRYPDIDLILVRENSEDIYKGIEHEIVPGVVESLKVVTRTACDRIARFAFGVVRKHSRKHLTFVHKGNIMKQSDGLFMATVRQVADEHPDVEYREIIADAICMQLVLDPCQFDVLLTGNLYGDILSNLGSGLAGGISGAHSINIGNDCRVYEAIHGDAPHLVGTGRANPLPFLSPALALLRHVGQAETADRIHAAVTQILTAGKTRTPDLGGNATTRQMANAIIGAL